MIDTDTRQLKRLSDGSWRSGAGKTPCDHCGINSVCAFRDAWQGCKAFMPALPFQGEVGMDSVFNTVRVGRAWTERLTPGEIVMLYDAKAKQMIGRAKVLHLAVGNIVHMMRDHAHANHLMLDTPPQEAARKLLLWQRRNYGPRIIHQATTITAIYLLRSDIKPHTTFLEGIEEDRSAESGAEGSREDC